MAHTCRTMTAQLKASTVHSQVPNGQCPAHVCHTACCGFLTKQTADSLCVLFILEYRINSSMSAGGYHVLLMCGAQPDTGAASWNAMFLAELVLS